MLALKKSFYRQRNVRSIKIRILAGEKKVKWSNKKLEILRAQLKQDLGRTPFWSGKVATVQERIREK